MITFIQPTVKTVRKRQKREKRNVCERNNQGDCWRQISDVPEKNLTEVVSEQIKMVEGEI